MTKLTLLAKIYNSHQMGQIENILADLIGDLSVEFSVGGTLAGKWVQLELSGEDEGVAVKLLEREIGLCPAELGNVKKFGSFKGYVTGFEKSKDNLLVDVGVVEPKGVHAVVSLNRLQAHLGGGKKFSLKRLGEYWGLCENLPLQLKVLEVGSPSRIEADLQESQVKRLVLWKDSLLDRLIVIGASLLELNSAVAQAGLGRDIIEVEALGLFEHALVCKLGTDAAGIVGQIGRRLRKAKFTVFNPKKIDFEL